jgi:hypothetical protein
MSIKDRIWRKDKPELGKVAVNFMDADSISNRIGKK